MKSIISIFFLVLLTSCSSQITKEECKKTCFLNNLKFDSIKYPVCECIEKDNPKELLFKK